MSATAKPAIFRAGRAWAVLAVAALAPPVQAADVFKGKDIYARQCSICHGPGGNGLMAGAPDFTRSEGLMQSDPMLLRSIKAGANAMPAYLGILPDRDILDVIAYLRTFAK